MKAAQLILLCVAGMPAVAQVEGGIPFRVRVINSVTRGPIGSANVALEQSDGNPVWGRTDSSGVFSGQSRSAGKHLLTVTRRGYRMTGERVGIAVDVSDGLEIAVPMLPLGVISGRVLDQYGDPVHNAIVRTEDKLTDPLQGNYYESFSTAITDDRGEYRIPEVEPGEHYVAVEYLSDELSVAGGRRWPKTGGLTLFPGVSGIAEALQVEVTAGGIMRLNDIPLKIQRAVTVGGRIEPPPKDTTAPLRLQRTDKLALSKEPMVQGAGCEPDGTFKMNVLPGTYTLTASDKTGKLSPPLTVHVQDKNIAGIILALDSSYRVHGRITVDGNTAVDFTKLRLNLGESDVKIGTGGTFETNLGGSPAVYVLQNLPEDWYVKDVFVGGKHIIGRQFEIQPGTTDMSMVLSPRGARLDIGLEGNSSDLPRLYVWLVPETGALPDVESLRGAQANPAGRFIVHAIPPGLYRVFSLDASNWAFALRPDLLLDKYRQSAPLISVAEGERKSIVVPHSKLPAE